MFVYIVFIIGKYKGSDKVCYCIRFKIFCKKFGIKCYLYYNYLKLLIMFSFYGYWYCKDILINILVVYGIDVFYSYF